MLNFACTVVYHTNWIAFYWLIFPIEYKINKKLINHYLSRTFNNIHPPFRLRYHRRTTTCNKWTLALSTTWGWPEWGGRPPTFPLASRGDCWLPIEWGCWLWRHKLEGFMMIVLRISLEGTVYIFLIGLWLQSLKLCLWAQLISIRHLQKLEDCPAGRRLNICHNIDRLETVNWYQHKVALPSYLGRIDQLHWVEMHISS